MQQVLNLQKVFDTATIVDQVCMWNMKRYPQEYNGALALTLLREEMNETKEAWESQDLVEILDGMGDIFFVCIGAMWKHGNTPKKIVEKLDILEDCTSIAEEVLRLSETTDTAEAFGRIALACVAELENLLRDEAAALDVLRAICISNDTKKVHNAGPAEKANIDKGKGYVPPTEDLCSIIKRTFAGAKHDT